MRMASGQYRKVSYLSSLPAIKDIHGFVKKMQEAKLGLGGTGL